MAFYCCQPGDLSPLMASLNPELSFINSPLLLTQLPRRWTDLLRLDPPPPCRLFCHQLRCWAPSFPALRFITCDL